MVKHPLYINQPPLSITTHQLASINWFIYCSFTNCNSFYIENITPPPPFTHTINLKGGGVGGRIKSKGSQQLWETTQLFLPPPPPKPPCLLLGGLGGLEMQYITFLTWQQLVTSRCQTSHAGFIHAQAEVSSDCQNVYHLMLYHSFCHRDNHHRTKTAIPSARSWNKSKG